MDSEEFLEEQRKELWRIKTRIIWLLIAAVVFVVQSILALIIRPPTNILPVTLGGLPCRRCRRVYTWFPTAC